MSRYNRYPQWVRPVARRVGDYAGYIPAAAYKMMGEEVKYQSKKAIRSQASKGLSYMTGSKHNSKIKRVPVKSNRKLSKDVVSCKKSLRQLKHLADASLGTLRYRKWTNFHCKSEEMAQGVKLIDTCDATALEAIMANMLFFNPAAPATLVSADLTTGVYSKDVLIKYLTSTLEIRNNYQVESRIKVYLLEARGSTSSSATVAWDNGISDNPYDTSGSPTFVSRTQMTQYPTDYPIFNTLYKSKVLKDLVLQPGQSTKVKHTVKNIKYDTALLDKETEIYKKAYKSFSFLVVTQGTVSHDSSITGEVGIGESDVDIKQNMTAIVEYDAGINIDYVHLDNDTINSFSIGAVQSNRPESNNQGYARG